MGRRYLKKRGNEYFYHGELPDPDNHKRRGHGEFVLKNPVELGRVPHYQEGDEFQRRLERPFADLQREIDTFGEDIFILCQERDYVIMKGVPVWSYNPSRLMPRDALVNAGEK